MNITDSVDNICIIDILVLYIDIADLIAFLFI